MKRKAAAALALLMTVSMLADADQTAATREKRVMERRH